MNLALKPYPEYKDSGVEWLGEVPVGWEVRPGMAAFREVERLNRGMLETTVLSLSYGRVVVRPPEKLHGLVPASFETYQIIQPGEIVIRPTDLQNDVTSLRVGLARGRGIITSAYMCLQPARQMASEYGFLLLHTYDLKKILYGLGSGLRQNLDFGDFRRLPVLLPPLPEQQQIAAFLAHFDRRVNRLIRAKRRMIELLEEQKQAIIQQAVTRGLDPSVPMKASGVEWLGEVPAHWEVRGLSSLLRRIDQGVSPQAEARLAEDGAWGVLKAGCVNGGVFREAEHKRLPDGFPVDQRLVLHPGDVLVSRACGSPRFVGSTGRVGHLSHQLILCDKTFRLVFRDARYAEFVTLAMNSRYFRTQVETAISGAQGLANNLPVSALKAMKLAVPPALEAEDVATALMSSTAAGAGLVSSARREMDLLREYRTRLMADVVTGKLDVRGIDLGPLDEPEEPDDIEPGDDCEPEDVEDTEEQDDADD